MHCCTICQEVVDNAGTCSKGCHNIGGVSAPCAHCALLLWQVYPDWVGFYPLQKCPLRRVNPWVRHPGRSLTEKTKVFRYTVFPKKPAGTPCVQPWLVAPDGWRLAAIGGWQLATGGWWRLVMVGGGWWLAVGGWWRSVVVGGWRLVAAGGWRRLAAVGGWRLVAVGCWWELAVGGWWSLGAVLQGGP